MQLDYEKYFKNKNITKQGFGYLGRGANVVKFLIETGANVLVTDMKSESELEKSLQELEDFVRIKYFSNLDENNSYLNRKELFENFLDESGNRRIVLRLGEHRKEDFINCDYVIQASGVPKNNEYLLFAKENNKKVYQEGSLFCEIIREYNNTHLAKENIKVIGVTGTRGKTTTTFLIKNIIEEYLISENENNKTLKKVYFGGNIQNIATLENLKNIKAGDTIVMELDSWVLQGFNDINYSPQIAVFTTFMSDHMNYYKGSMNDYFEDKAAIFLNQKEGDVFIATDKIYEEIEKCLSQNQVNNFKQLPSKKIVIGEKEVEECAQEFKSLLLGDHNKVNLALAVRAVREYGADSAIIQKTLNTFTGVPGRLELVKVLGGVSYYNDSTSTTPDALLAALKSFKKDQIILICGGRDKELEITKLVTEIIEHKNKNLIKSIIILDNDTTNGSQKMIRMFNDRNFTHYITASSLELAVKEATEIAYNSGIILFSPGFASFGMFLNEYDRGEKFIEILNSQAK
ncbi:MAG: UDP-N-acetylmuramoylalanine--D-glutamate ligase [Patescibacteria group bacterium]|nr:UDP-N-acetylmuramoylalanine--D-glutamate ligase [Patescibacteria group bacterium]